MEAFPTFRVKGVGQREMGPQGGGREEEWGQCSTAALSTGAPLREVRESLSLQKRN